MPGQMLVLLLATNGIPVTFKASIPEPSIKHKHEYELIFHPDGRLTFDWAGNLEKVVDMIRVKRNGVTFECDTVEEALMIASLDASISSATRKNASAQPDTVTEHRRPLNGAGRCGGAGRC